MVKKQSVVINSEGMKLYKYFFDDDTQYKNIDLTWYGVISFEGMNGTRHTARLSDAVEYNLINIYRHHVKPTLTASHEASENRERTPLKELDLRQGLEAEEKRRQWSHIRYSGI